MANRLIYDIPKEPKGEVYRKLINLAMHFCDIALLVVRNTSYLNSSGAQVLEALEPFLLLKAKETQWPGTVLLCDELFPDNTATVYRSRLCRESAEILKEAVDGLYSWQQPERPEDLCLLRPDGSPWLVTIAHEADSYFELTLEEKDLVLGDLPELGPLVEHEQGKR